jgi:hypothetical protein
MLLQHQRVSIEKFIVGQIKVKTIRLIFNLGVQFSLLLGSKRGVIILSEKKLLKTINQKNPKREKSEKELRVKKCPHTVTTLVFLYIANIHW